MTTEERLAVLENENTHQKEELAENKKEITSLRKDISDVKFKVKILWGIVGTIFSVLGIAFINFLLE